MEPQTATIVNKQKLTETITKYVDLIKQNKVYEFQQKIQLLAHRKQQSKRFEEAQFLLFGGIQNLFRFTPEQNIEAYSLLDHLLKIYQAHPQIWNLEKGSNFYLISEKVYELLNIRKSDKTYDYYVKFLKTLKNAPFPKEMIMDLVEIYILRDQFTRAESHVIELELSHVKKFLERWSEKVRSEEATAIRCRVALLRGLFKNFEECEELLEGVDRENPFFKFANFLISASKLKCREAYDLLGARYKQFLERDTIYNKIYLGYGSYYFKISSAKKGNSLMSLFE